MPQPKQSASYGEKMFEFLRNATISPQRAIFPTAAFPPNPGKPADDGAKRKAHTFTHRLHGLKRCLIAEEHPMAAQVAGLRVRSPKPHPDGWMVEISMAEKDFDGIIVEGAQQPAPQPPAGGGQKRRGSSMSDAIAGVLDEDE